MSSIIRFATDSGWAFLGRMGSVTLGLISSILLARVLSPADFGTYFLVLTIARVAMLVSQFGMNQVVVRFIAENIASGLPGKARDTVYKSFFISLIGSSFIGFFYWLSATFLAENVFEIPVMASVAGVVCLWILAGTLRLLAAECFRGFHDLKMASLFEIFAFEFFFSFFIFLAWSFYGDLSFQGAIFLSTIAAMISVFPAVLILQKKIKILPSGESVTYKVLLQTGWPLLISNLVFVLMTQVGLWIVGIISTSTDVALYASAFRLVMLMQLPLLILNSVVPQLIAKLHVHKKRSELEESLQLIALVEFIPTIIIYFVFVFAGETLLTHIFGAFYANSYWVLLILGSGILVNAMVGFCGPALMMTGHQHSLMLISLVCGILSLGLAFPIGKCFGVEGVASVMASGIGIQHILMLLVVKRKIGVWTMIGNFAGLKRGLAAIVR